MTENSKYNLTGITEKEDVFIKHFEDSLAGAEFLPQCASVLDVGSGAGFPGIPLAIVRRDLSVFLLDGNGKKCRFLSSCVEMLNLSGVKVVCGRAEEAASEDFHRERYDAVLSRAVAPLPSLLELCLPFVKIGGVFLSYKGKCVREEIEASSSALTLLGGKIAGVHPYVLDGGFGERSLVVIEKISPTPSKYPRGRGLERKKPL
ncbi:MAG: 16S rRNA (guanine(527)-N(7))-methyltransferase RsmG [Clostridia bacterium]|nr:16S rRNA (guanine(527)-N(7))-methyltransferase RsmG [Clostridia bacterium]